MSGLIFALASLAGMWKLFTKAGRPGWVVLIPIYNIIVMLNIIGRPVWYIVFLVIPGMQVVLAVILAFGLARSFGRRGPFAIGMILLAFIFIPHSLD